MRNGLFRHLRSLFSFYNDGLLDRFALQARDLPCEIIHFLLKQQQLRGKVILYRDQDNERDQEKDKQQVLHV